MMRGEIERSGSISLEWIPMRDCVRLATALIMLCFLGRATAGESPSPPKSFIAAGSFGATTPILPMDSPGDSPPESAERGESTIQTTQAIVISEDKAFPIDLATALRLADAQNLRIAFAREQIEEAAARYQSARALWLPSLRAGVGWNHHEGTLQETGGAVLDVSRSSLITGAGTQAVGAGSPAVPGVVSRFHLADALFEPLAARQAMDARNAGSQAVTNDTLLEVAQAYLELLGAVQHLAIAEESLRHAQHLAELTGSFAKSGQGLQADADRAATEQAIRENELERAKEIVRVRSARLAQLLRLDPSLVLAPLEPALVPLALVDEKRALADLVEQAQFNRPELSESRSLIQEAEHRLDRERLAPFIPNLAVGASYGGFGGAEGQRVRDFRDRLDVDLAAYWELRNLGLGDRAARQERRSRLQQVQLLEVALTNRIAREVVEAHAQVQARKPQMETARKGVENALSSYQRNLQRIQGGQGLPIEVLQSLQALAVIRAEHLRSLVDYNKAQFALLHAIGWPTLINSPTNGA